MATITFTNIPPEHFELVPQVFRVLKEGKERGEINEELVRSALGKCVAHFVSEPEAIQEMLAKWKRDKTTPLSWDFGSWIDAIASSSLIYQSVQLHPDGSGELSFEQRAWPSGALRQRKRSSRSSVVRSHRTARSNISFEADGYAAAQFQR